MPFEPEPVTVEETPELSAALERVRARRRKSAWRNPAFYVLGFVALIGVPLLLGVVGLVVAALASPATWTQANVYKLLWNVASLGIWLLIGLAVYKAVNRKQRP